MADKDINIEAQLVTGRNPRGIPTVVFIEDVAAFLQENGNPSVQTVLGAFSELHSKYKYMDVNVRAQKRNIKAKIPDLERTLELVRQLQLKQLENEPMQTMYNVTDTVYAKAEVDCNGTVGLWLGANVMLEYTYEEALELLENNLNNARTKLAQQEEDLAHLKSQMVTVEVNMNRLVLHEVAVQEAAAEEKKTA